MNRGKLNSATLKNAISDCDTLNSATLMQHLIVHYYNSEILNNVTITTAKITRTTVTSEI